MTFRPYHISPGDLEPLPGAGLAGDFADMRLIKSVNAKVSLMIPGRGVAEDLIKAGARPIGWEKVVPASTIALSELAGMKWKRETADTISTSLISGKKLSHFRELCGQAGIQHHEISDGLSTLCMVSGSSFKSLRDAGAHIPELRPSSRSAADSRARG